MLKQPTICGFIFDLDGTLIESRLDFAWLRSQLNCPFDQDLLAYVDALPKARQREAQHIIEQHEHDDAQQAALLPGAKTLLDRLPQQRTAIVTRNSKKAASLKLLNNRVQVDQLITREDAPPKPAPDALRRVAQQWQLAEYQCIYVGDYLYDIQAANNAGMTSCLYAPLSDGPLPNYSGEADMVIRHLDELLARLRN